ncbi:EAL domain-containing protein [Methylobacillus caricis]|uniref:putative bifunctional diguanylate cyclase/phosphodiesterase n=1 Tax=Methylobacillus caricis TaxID=1971611 RepID=UPI001CFF6DDB|nr:EAL domain-containing protein [Methylobacillus caricis]MCB5188198.1 EAL domain-containing protein [Methylobacillus caricis]
MKCPMIPPDENERLQALAAYGLGQDRPLPALEPVVQIAARMFDMPVAAINMIGSDHVFFAASVGVGTVDMGRDVSFCAHAINQTDVMVVPDSHLDERFHDNPLVIGPANLRFYAGVPLTSPDGYALGALCVIDGQPREFSDEDCERLRELAKMAVDRLELRRLEISTEQSRRPFEEFARNSPTAVVWFDAHLKIIAWNQAAATLHGYRLDEGEGLFIDQLIPEREHHMFHQLVSQAVTTGTFDGISMPETAYGLRKDGTEFELGLSLFCWQEHGQLIFNAHLHDITAKKREEEELHRLATTDLLTGLANRGCFYREVEHALVAARPIAVLMLDLDGFKDVNDTLGHAVGDSILREVAHRLEEGIGKSGLAARIGGDEFALLVHPMDDLVQAQSIAQTLINSLAKSIVIDHHEIRITASCGVAISPQHAQEALELIGNADLALFHAKRLGGAQSFVFVPALRMEAVARHLYGLELHRAVHEGELVLFYQPQIRLSDGSLAGAEALIRWRHPERGLLSPAAFLPALENGPLAATVGDWVLDQACAQVAQWRRYGLRDFRMGVNLFGAQFRVDDLAAKVISVLERHGLPPSALELEITENIVLEHDEVALESLRRLREAGVGVAFDDFGTGYASLSLLKQYPLSRIKIDRSFVQGMLESQQDKTVINAVIDMANAYSLETIAEGIETAEQQMALLEIGCSEGQGYLFSRPLPAIEFADMFGLVHHLSRLSRNA